MLGVNVMVMTGVPR